MGKINSNPDKIDGGVERNAAGLESSSTDEVAHSTNSLSTGLSLTDTTIRMPASKATESALKQGSIINDVKNSNPRPELSTASATEGVNIFQSDPTTQPLHPSQSLPEKTMDTTKIIPSEENQSKSLLSNEPCEQSVMQPPAKKQRIEAKISLEQGSDVAGLSHSDNVKIGTPINPLHLVATPKSAPIPSTIGSTTQLLLPDYAAVRQTVIDLIGLLQLYGPLTANQLEYNLPPVLPATIPWSVHDVLSILVAIGLVQQVKGTNQYCMFGGIPRADVILPMDINNEIQQALNEAEDSWKRSQILRDALRKLKNNHTNNGKHKHYKDVLQQIILEYPQVSNDPVYWTALRNCNIDMHTGGNTGSEKRISNTGGSHSSSKKVANKSPKVANMKTHSVPPEGTMLPPAATETPPISAISTAAAASTTPAETGSSNTTLVDQRKAAECARPMVASTIIPTVVATENNLPSASEAPSS